MGMGIEAGIEKIEERSVLYALKEGELYQLDSMYESDRMLDLWTEKLDVTYYTKVFMFGVGNGMYVRKLLEKIGDSGLIFVYEPDDVILAAAFREFGLEKLLTDPRVRLLRKADENEDEDLFTALGALIDYSDLAAMKVTAYLNYDVLYPAEYKYFIETVLQIKDSVATNRRVYERFARYYVPNALDNAKTLAVSRDINDLGSRLPEGYTGLVVSAGPSLTKNIELIKEMRGRAFIVATDSAVKVLLQHGIVPDIFASVDPNKSPKHFDEDIIKNIPIICEYVSCPGAMNGHNGPYFYSRSEDLYINRFMDDNGIPIITLETGGSVACNCISFLIKTGAGRIVMVGQDLAYTDNKSHADGATRASWGLDLDTGSVMVEGIDGKPIKSSGEFEHYRRWIERTIAQYPELEFINATEGGARIHGAKEMTLRAVIDDLTDELFDYKNAIYDSEYLMDEDIRPKFTEYMGEIADEMNLIRDLLRHVIRLYEDMYRMVVERKYQNNQFKKHYDAGREITDKLGEIKSFYYAECMVQEEITALMKKPVCEADDEVGQLKEGINESLERMKLFLKGSELVLGILK